jgi:hypothetical protein
MTSGFGKRAGLPGWAGLGWAGVRVAATVAFVAAARLLPPLTSLVAPFLPALRGPLCLLSW